jgi:gamma-tubulin complex component 5
VYNEDPLADALKERVDDLGKEERKWTPEILHLLLELSERPVEYARANKVDLDFLNEEEEVVEEKLRWRDLVREDEALRENSVWANVDFKGGSSEDEDQSGEESEGSDETGLSSVGEDSGRRVPRLVVDTLDIEDFENLRKAQFWKKTPSVNGVKLETVKKPITELQAIREVLFMLAGLSTSLFEVESDTVTPSKGYALKHASTDAFQNIVEDLAHHGSALNVLRSWTKRPQSIPLLQILQSSIADRIRNFDACLSSIHKRFVAPEGDTVVTLLSVQFKISSCLRPLVRLSEVVKRLDGEPYAHAFRYLEMLYDETCTSQMAGDDEIYAFMGTIFFDCFQVYLRSIRMWMEDGELATSDKVFFVSEVAGDIDLPSLWESRFKIRKTQDGVLHAPRFLRAAANKIFTTGKSVVVLKYLNQFETLQSSRVTFEPKLDFETVCKPSLLHLAAFPELFDVAFDDWIQSKHHYASSTLRTTLFDSCGLHTSLDALSHLYFMADGTTAAPFTNAIFDKLDTLDSSWNDRFTLTELAQSTFGAHPSVYPDRLRTNILSLPRKYQDVSRCRRSVKSLAVIEFKYQLSWPIQIILTPPTLKSYQKISTFLLQIRRTSHILSRQRLTAEFSKSISVEQALCYSLRTRLLWFTGTLYYYLSSLVLSLGTQIMLSALKSADDVDSMIAVHASYIKSITEKALLGSKLELIHRSVLKILDLGIKLEDAHAANKGRADDEEEKRKERLENSIAGLGLHTPRKASGQPLFAASWRGKGRKVEDDSESEEEKEVDVDLSILSSQYDEEESYEHRLREMKAMFDREVRFVVSGLRGVARAGVGEEARAWDALGELLESGLGGGGWR